MDCQDVRASLSARLDGEPAELSEDVVDAHVSGCEQCSRWYSTVTALGRDLTMGVAGTAEEPARSAELVAAEVLASAKVPAASFRRRQYPLLFARLALVALALVYFVWSGILLFGAGPVDEGDAQFVFDAATFRFALGVGLLWAAARPKVASAVLPIYLALWGFSAGFATRDLVLGLSGQDAGASPLWGLVLNLAALVTLLVCWLGRHHVFMPLSQSWRTATAQPLRFSSADLIRNSTYRAGDRDRPEL